MPVHKLLRGANAGLYLPFALGRLRAMEAIDPEGFFSEQYLIGGYFVRIRQAREERYIDISAVLASYEFFTSEHVMQHPLASPGHTYAENGIGAFVCGSGVRATFNRRMVEAKGHHLASSSLVPAFDQDWRQVSCEILTGPDSYGFLTWPAWQNQKFHEHTWHPNNDGLSLVTSTQAQMPGHNNQGNWLSPYTGFRIANGGAKTADQGFDTPPAYYDGNGTTWAGPQMDYPHTWWRHAAVAKSDRGRLFFICTDNYGRFQVYRVAKHDDTNAIVEIGHYQMLTPPYPGWVSVPAPGDSTKYVNHWTWRFNKDATKCVSCPFHSDTSAGFKTYLDGFLMGAAIHPDFAGSFTPPEAVIDAHEDTPGLVEFGIEIIETGDGELDFTVNFTLLRQSYFGTASPARWFMDAAYTLPNVPGVDEDTLVTLEMECRVPAGNYQPSVSLTAGFDTYYYYDAHWGVKCSVVVNANSETLAPTEKLRFVTQYPLQGKFPTLATFRTYGTVPGVPWSGGSGMDLPLAAGGTIFVPWAGPVDHDPDSLNGTYEGVYGSIIGFLHALELSTLSWVYEQGNYITGMGMFRAQSHGVTLFSADFDLVGSPKPDFGYAPTEPIPSSRVHQCAVSFMLATELAQCFSVHPAGHFAFNPTATIQALGGGEALDWISVVGTDEEGNPTRTRFKHRDLFNEAFGQNRPYSFYWEDFPGKGYFDMGGFRTHGIWVTFR